ncbi:MAG: hypothetical protein HFH77_10200 [Lachnospiraceae bacterium]|nr:hypothetical protein [Lachnospiraceae bacterium]
MYKEDKMNQLRNEVENCYKLYKDKRQFYEKRVRFFNFVLTVFPVVIAAMFVISSVFTEYASECQLVGLLFSILFIIMGYIAKNSSYDVKLIQRGTTYFALCNLSRRMRFAIEPENRYEEFALEFQKIMEHENEMSLMNSLELVGLFRKYYQNGVEQEKNLQMQNQNE